MKKISQAFLKAWIWFYRPSPPKVNLIEVTFTADNWNAPQLVIVTGADDDLDDRWQMTAFRRTKG